MTRYRHGVGFIVGKPGAGKSWLAVSRIVESLPHRPVYSNLPLKASTIAAYMRLKHGKPYRPYPVTKQHFDAAAARFVRLAAATEDVRDKLASVERAVVLSSRSQSAQRRILRWARKRYDVDAVVAKFDAQDPPIYFGSGANAFYPGSELFLDELHRWYRVDSFGKSADEPKDVQVFLSMHRHAQLRIWCITQDPRNVSVSFRRFAERGVWVVDAGEEVSPLGVPYRLFGLRGVRWLEFYLGAAELSASPPRGSPVDGAFMFWWSPRARVIHRLYASYSQLGSVRRSAELAELATTAGTSVGTNAGGRRVIKFRWLVALALVVAFVVWVVAGRSADRSLVPEGASVPVAAAGSMAPPSPPPPLSWLNGRPMWRGRVLESGAVIDGWMVMGVGSEFGVVVVRDGRVWGSKGSAQWVDLGDQSAMVDALRRRWLEVR